MALIATRRMTVAGRQIERGAEVASAMLPPGKAEQLIELRQLRETEQRETVYRACRSFVVHGKPVERNATFKIKSLSADKVRQLLEQRYIEPVV